MADDAEMVIGDAGGNSWRLTPLVPRGVEAADGGDDGTMGIARWAAEMGAMIGVPGRPGCELTGMAFDFWAAPGTVGGGTTAAFAEIAGSCCCCSSCTF